MWRRKQGKAKMFVPQLFASLKQHFQNIAQKFSVKQISFFMFTYNREQKRWYGSHSQHPLFSLMITTPVENYNIIL